MDELQKLKAAYEAAGVEMAKFTTLDDDYAMRNRLANFSYGVTPALMESILAEAEDFNIKHRARMAALGCDMTKMNH